MNKGLFPEDDYIMISALQHYVFCPRQCALIHVEDLWQENLFTVRGNILHEKVDSDTYETRGSVKTVRGLRIHSRRLGISGRADVVEFYSKNGSGSQLAAMPVEFKAGQPKKDQSDQIQLCAQALCLEEMLGVPVKQGAFFYARIRRRVKVDMTPDLQEKTQATISAVRELVTTGKVPRLNELLQQSGLTTSAFLKKCARCSLLEACQPKAMRERRRQQYLEDLYSP